MSHKQDQKRADEGQVFRDGKLVPKSQAKEGADDKKRAICKVPGCGKTYLVEEGRPPLCSECLQFLERLIFFLPRIKIEQGKTGGGIIVPGHKEFKPTLDGKEIKTGP